jgi:hypothetical protein
MRLRKTPEGAEVGLLFIGVIVARLLGSLSGLPASLVDWNQWLLAIVAAVAALGGAAPRPPTYAASLRYGTDGKEDP